jgi:hypothetical protein
MGVPEHRGQVHPQEVRVHGRKDTKEAAASQKVKRKGEGEGSLEIEIF